MRLQLQKAIGALLASGDRHGIQRSYFRRNAIAGIHGLHAVWHTGLGGVYLVGIVVWV